MFSFFSSKKSLDLDGAWPKAAIVEVLRARYDALDHLGDDEGFSLYKATDGKLHFVIALVEVHGASDHVTEVGFLARFVGFAANDAASEFINRNAHISTSGLESEGDLYLIAGVQAAGRFDAGTFVLVLEAWKRDLMLAIHALSGGQSAPFHPVVGLERARMSAANIAPGMETVADARIALDADDGGAPDLSPEDAPMSESAPKIDAFSHFFGEEKRLSVCGDCEGRGKRGFVAKTCEACSGAGLVKAVNNRA